MGSRRRRGGEKEWGRDEKGGSMMGGGERCGRG